MDMVLNEDAENVCKAVLMTLPCFAKPHELIEELEPRFNKEGYDEYASCGHSAYSHVCTLCEPDYSRVKLEKQKKILEIVETYIKQDQVAHDLVNDPRVRRWCHFFICFLNVFLH